MKILNHLRVFLFNFTHKILFSNQYLASFEKPGNHVLFGNDDDCPIQFPSAFETKSGKYFYSKFIPS